MPDFFIHIPDYLYRSPLLAQRWLEAALDQRHWPGMKIAEISSAELATLYASVTLSEYVDREEGSTEL